MDLTTRVIPTMTQLRGEATFTAAAGKNVKIETSPVGEDILDVTVPVGKLWTITVGIDVRETDA